MWNCCVHGAWVSDKKIFYRVSSWCIGLGIWCCHYCGLDCCYGTGLIPSPGTSTYCKCSPPLPKSILHLTWVFSKPITNQKFFTQDCLVLFKVMFSDLEQFNVLISVWNDSYLLFEVSLYLVNHTGQFLYSWFQATKVALVYPGRWESMRTKT